jgi:transposase InsO family protein
VLPFYEKHELPLLRILTDRGTEYYGKAETHDYQLYMAINDIEHTKATTKSPQTNGICERFHKTILQEFYQVIRARCAVAEPRWQHLKMENKSGKRRKCLDFELTDTLSKSAFVRSNLDYYNIAITTEV